MLCSAVKHAGSGRAQKRCRGKHETQSSVFLYSSSALPLRTTSPFFLLWRKGDKDYFPSKLRVHIKDNNSPHDKFHRFYSYFLANRFRPKLRLICSGFSIFHIYPSYVTLHTQWAWVTYEDGQWCWNLGWVIYIAILGYWPAKIYYSVLF